MKRFNALMLGTALVAALSFAQNATPKPSTDKPATDKPAESTTAPAKTKKHKKHVKKDAPATSNSTAPATK